MLRIENSRNNRFFGAAIIWNHVIEIEKKEAGYSIESWKLKIENENIEIWDCQTRNWKKLNKPPGGSWQSYSSVG